MHSTIKIKRVSLSRVTAWLLVALTGFAYLLNYADRQVIFSIFPLLKSELHFNNMQLGLTSSVFLWIYGLCSPFAGRAADRLQKNVLLCVSLIGWSAVTFLTGLANSPAAVLICRGLMGITEALFVPVAVSVIAGAHGTRTRSLAIGLLFSAQLAGLVVGGWFGGFIAQVYDWRLAFYLLGAIGAIYSIPYYVFLKRVPHAQTPESELSQARSYWMDLLHTPTYVCLCLAFPTYTALLWLLYTWLPSLLFEKFQLSLSAAAFTATFYLQVATLGGLVCGGFLADWLCRWTKAGRFWVLCCGMILSSPWAQVAGHTEKLHIVKLALAAFGFFGGMFMSNLMASALDVVYEANRGAAVGLINCVGTPASGLAALVAGALKEKIGLTNIISCGAAISTLAGLVLAISVKVYFTKDYAKAIA